MIKREPDLDLALLRLPPRSDDEPPRRAVDIGDSNLVTKDDILFVLGFPIVEDSLNRTQKPTLTATAGTLSALNEGGRFKTDLSVTYGNSGGPVFDQRGRVVAIVVGGIPKLGSTNYLIPINYTLGLLRLLGPRY